MKWQNSMYSDSDMSRMQRDAIQRTKEMQRKAREAAERFNRNFADNAPNARKPQSDAGSKNKSESAASFLAPTTPEIKEAPDTPVARIFDALNLDREKTILIGLLLILLNDGGIREGKNQKLLMALAYLLFF